MARPGQVASCVLFGLALGLALAPTPIEAQTLPWLEPSRQAPAERPALPRAEAPPRVAQVVTVQPAGPEDAALPPANGEVVPRPAAVSGPGVGGYAVCAPMHGVDCQTCGPCGEAEWEEWRALSWQQFAQGEYVGHARPAHVPEYRLRVDDQLQFVYRVTREETTTPYELTVGDEVQVESATAPELKRSLIVQPDGTITLYLLGQVKATRKTVDQLARELNERYKTYFRVPAITVTPLKVNTRLEDVRAAVDARYGTGGQGLSVRVTPEGSIALPVIGNVFVQELTLEELGQELNERYRMAVEGLEVTPILVERAPRYVFVLGEVKVPGRYELEGPTTSMQAISLAGGWNVGANLRQVVVFRRGDDWRLMATMLDLRGALYGKRPCPSDEVWLADSDVVVVPKSPILVLDDFINLVFTRGIYGVVPFNMNYTFSRINTLGN
jgi:polysaccharide export outer membrane protein